MEKGAQSYPGQVLAVGGTQARGRDAKCPRAGRKPAGGMPNVHGRDAKVARGQDAGGTLSRPARLPEASFRRRQEALCKPLPCLTLLN